MLVYQRVTGGETHLLSGMQSQVGPRTHDDRLSTFRPFDQHHRLQRAEGVPQETTPLAQDLRTKPWQRRCL